MKIIPVFYDGSKTGTKQSNITSLRTGIQNYESREGTNMLTVCLTGKLTRPEVKYNTISSAVNSLAHAW